MGVIWAEVTVKNTVEDPMKVEGEYRASLTQGESKGERVNR